MILIANQQRMVLTSPSPVCEFYLMKESRTEGRVWLIWFKSPQFLSEY